MALSGVRSSWLMLARNCDLCWLASASWRLFSSISSNSRAFSIAITAWSAKVATSSICLSVNGRTSARVSVNTPTGTPSRSIGTPSMVRNLAELLRFWPIEFGIGSGHPEYGRCVPSTRARPVPVLRAGFDRLVLDVFEKGHRKTEGDRAVEMITFLLRDRAHVGIAQPGC